MDGFRLSSTTIGASQRLDTQEGGGGEYMRECMRESMERRMTVRRCYGKVYEKYLVLKSNFILHDTRNRQLSKPPHSSRGETNARIRNTILAEN